MAKVPQKLKKTRSEIYKNAPIAKFGERKPDYTTMGRKIKNRIRNSGKWSVWRPAALLMERQEERSRFFGNGTGALAIKEVLERTNGKVKPVEVDYIFMGQVVPAGCGQIPGRQATILAGVPESVPSITIKSKFVHPALRRLIWLFQMILLGRADIGHCRGTVKYEQLSLCAARYAVVAPGWDY